MSFLASMIARQHSRSKNSRSTQHLLASSTKSHCVCSSNANIKLQSSCFITSNFANVVIALRSLIDWLIDRLPDWLMNSCAKRSKRTEHMGHGPYRIRSLVQTLCLVGRYVRRHSAFAIFSQNATLLVVAPLARQREKAILNNSAFSAYALLNH